MWKNVLLPLLFIIIAAALTVYFWYAEAPWSFMGMVGLVTLAISSMYIAYFIGYSIFPDKRNIPLPPLREVPRFYSEQKKHPQDITKGSLFSALLVIMFILLGVLGIKKLAKEYKYYELKKRKSSIVKRESGIVKGIMKW